MTRLEELKEQIAAMSAEVTKLEAEKKDLDRQNAKIAGEAWKLIVRDPNNFEFRADKREDINDWPRPGRLSGLRVERRIKPELISQFQMEHGKSPSINDDWANWNGMFYYRTEEGILTQSGGGHHVLNNPLLCSDEEWEQITNGDVPEKFIYRIG